MMKKTTPAQNGKLTKNSTFRTKSDLIRSCSEKMPVKEVIALGEKFGFVIRTSQVYAMRKVMRTMQKSKIARIIDRARSVATKAKAPAASTPTPQVAPQRVLTSVTMTSPKTSNGAKTPSTPNVHSLAVHALRTIASEVGLNEAIQILTDDHKAVLKMLHGA